MFITFFKTVCKNTVWQLFHPLSFKGRDGLGTFVSKALGLMVIGFILGILTNLPIWNWMPNFWRWIGIIYLACVAGCTCTRRAHDVGYGFWEWLFCEIFSFTMLVFKREKWNGKRLLSFGSPYPNEYGPAPQENLKFAAMQKTDVYQQNKLVPPSQSIQGTSTFKEFPSVWNGSIPTDTQSKN